METALKLLAGAVAGAAAGFLLGRARPCAAGSCRTRGNTLYYFYYLLAGAVFGAAVAWYWIHR